MEVEEALYFLDVLFIASARSYESLQAKLVGMENMIEQMIGQVCSAEG